MSGVRQGVGKRNTFLHGLRSRRKPDGSPAPKADEGSFKTGNGRNPVAGASGARRRRRTWLTAVFVVAVVAVAAGSGGWRLAKSGDDPVVSSTTVSLPSTLTLAPSTTFSSPSTTTTAPTETTTTTLARDVLFQDDFSSGKAWATDYVGRGLVVPDGVLSLTVPQNWYFRYVKLLSHSFDNFGVEVNATSRSAFPVAAEILIRTGPRQRQAFLRKREIYRQPPRQKTSRRSQSLTKVGCGQGLLSRSSS